VFYLDESGFDPRAVSESGWAPRGKRLAGKRVGKREKRLSIIALRNDDHKLLCPMTYTGTMTKEYFEWYLEKVSKVLPKGSVIVLDNASCHTRLSLGPLLTTAGISLIYLPPYSPELNPIEKLWGSVKTRLKRIYRYVTEDLFEAVSIALRKYADPNWVNISY
jgi:transposase